MESTGEKGRIQISSVTADILADAGHSNWTTPRTDGVAAKGKGVLSTYWLMLGNDPFRSVRIDIFDSEDQAPCNLNPTASNRESDMDRLAK